GPRRVGSESGPPGLGPGTCGSRVRCEPAGQSLARPLSWAVGSQLPIVSRSFTGMTRDQTSTGIVISTRGFVRAAVVKLTKRASARGMWAVGLTRCYARSDLDFRVADDPS